MGDFSRDSVRAQLEKMLLSPDFMAGKQLSQFLRYVVEQALDGQSNSIKQYTIAVDALGYGADFDPNTNPTVRVLAGRLRHALDRYYLGPGIQDPIRIVIPKGSYVPEYIDNQSGSKVIGAPESPPPVSEEAKGDLQGATIAVTNFENLNKNDENLFLARALTEEILISLTRFSGLRVLGPLFLGEENRIDYHQIFHGYGTRFVLQGWIRSQDSAIRITIDLTDASTGAKQWGRTFEYDLEKSSLFEIEDEVASQVVGEIADSVGIIFQKLLSETYHEYIKLNDVTNAVFRYHNAWMTLDPWDWKETIDAILKALHKEPQNALLIALLSESYFTDVVYELGLEPEAFSKMGSLAHKAFSIDPNLQIARYNLVVQNCFHGRAQEAVEEAHRVVALNPNHARIIAGCSSVLTLVGEYKLGKELIERAKELNPHYPGWYHLMDYVIHFRHERYEEAWTEALKVNVEGLFWHPLLRAAVLGKLGRTKEAKVYLDDLLKMKPDFPKRPRDIIRLLFFIDELNDMIWDGLCKAGVMELD